MRIILVILGGLLLIVGGIGVVIPVWPTTPFVLLASGCFAAGSPALNAKLTAHPFFGEFICNYRHKTGVRDSVKLWSVLFLWASLGISIALTSSLHIHIALTVIGLAVSAHILTLRRKKP